MVHFFLNFITWWFSEVTIPFWIIDTDYTDYALAYSCENDGEDFKYGKIFFFFLGTLKTTNCIDTKQKFK